MTSSLVDVFEEPAFNRPTPDRDGGTFVREAGQAASPENYPPVGKSPHDGHNFVYTSVGR